MSLMGTLCTSVLTSVSLCVEKDIEFYEVEKR